MEHGQRDRLLKRLLDWRPPSGVLSVYVDTDPADRTRGWRISLRDRLGALAERTTTHGSRRAFEAAAARVLERFPEDGPPPDGRGHAGFIEVAEKPAEVWRSMQMAPRRVEAVHSQRPYLRPLVEIFAEGPYVGVVLASADRVRLLDWSLGALRGLDDWEITLWSRDWRERKAERSRPGQRTTSASGRDQFNQRLEANRQRFLREAGEHIGAELSRRKWQFVIVFGPKAHAEQLSERLRLADGRVHVSGHDLISASEDEITTRVGVEVRDASLDRERALIREIGEAIGRSAGAALGPKEVLEALGEGRVRHLIFDADRDYTGRPLDVQIPDASGGGDGGVPVIERMIELALTTGAEITPVEGDPKSELSEHDGVAALLRY